MADKAFGVKDIDLIGASGTPTIECPGQLNITCTNVAISTDITVGQKVSVGAGTSISSPGPNILTFGTNNTEQVRVNSDGGVGIGTTNPHGELGLYSDGFSNIRIISARTGSSQQIGSVGFSTFAPDGTHDPAGAIIGRVDGQLILNSGVTAVRVHNDGNVEIEDGNLVIGTAGHGIDFSEQTASSASGSSTTSEILDHYEEGTWTPQIRGASTAGSYTYQTQEGMYTRIGRYVYATASLTQIVTGSAGSGDLEVFGLPFSSDSNGRSHLGSVMLDQWDINNATMNLVSVLAPGNTKLTVREIKDSSTDSNVSVVDKASDTADIVINIQYFV